MIYHIVTPKALANAIKNLGFGVTLKICPKLRQNGLALVSHIKQSLHMGCPQYDFGQGGSMSEDKDNREKPGGASQRPL